jgi:hypothetical protein
MSWIDLAQYMDQWNVIVNIQVPQNARKSFRSFIIGELSRKVQLHGVSGLRRKD